MNEEMEKLLALAKRLEVDAIADLQDRANPFSAISKAAEAKGIRLAIKRLLER